MLATPRATSGSRAMRRPAWSITARGARRERAAHQTQSNADSVTSTTPARCWRWCVGAALMALIVPFAARQGPLGDTLHVPTTPTLVLDVSAPAR